MMVYGGRKEASCYVDEVKFTPTANGLVPRIGRALSSGSVPLFVGDGSEGSRSALLVPHSVIRFDCFNNGTVLSTLKPFGSHYCHLLSLSPFSVLCRRGRQPRPPLHTSPILYMIKRMATKITAHIGGHQQHNGKGLPPTPNSGLDSSLDSLYDHRESISTERTSASLGDVGHMMATLTVNPTPRFVPQRRAQRPKGTYRLSDFIIQRTLGTGSFGRVHLGTSIPLLRRAGRG